MFDYIMAQINALMSSGRATWDDVAARLQTALNEADSALRAHESIEYAANEQGRGFEWQSIADKFILKLSIARDLAQAMNFVQAGAVNIPSGLGLFPLLPALAGLTTAGALAFVATLYILVTEAKDFYFVVTGVKPPDSGNSFGALLKWLIIGGAIVMIAPKVLEYRK